MTAGDVMNLILADPRLTKYVNLADQLRAGTPLDERDDTGIAVMVWSQLVQELKPEQGYMPLSPTEVERAKRILRVLLDSLTHAHAANKSHFRPVDPGGR